MKNRESPPLKITQPGVCGHASVDLLRAYLTRNITFLQFANRCELALKKLPDDPPGQTCICFVSEEDLDNERRRKGTKTEGIVNRSFNFVITPSSTEPVPCLHWSRSLLGRESLFPRLIPSLDISNAKLFSISEPWIEVLCRLQQQPIIDLIRCKQFAPEERAIGIKDEIQKRMSVFGEFGHAFYFQNSECLVAWDIAENWRTWEALQTPFNKRREELCGRWGFNVSENEFRLMSPSEHVKTLRKSPVIYECPSFADRVSERVRQLFVERPIRKQFTGRMTKSGDLIYDEVPPLPFSRGGDYWLPFCLRYDTCFRRFPKKNSKVPEETLRDELWWWNTRTEWFEDLRNEFPDNWERSAFLYELRARLLPNHTWDIFKGPWIQLDASQRGVLYYLWPPERRGKHWREGRIASDNPAEYEFRNAHAMVDPTASSAKLKESLDAGSGAFYRYELFGVSGKPKRQKAPKKDWKWMLLEALDQDHVGFTTLTNAQIKAKQRAVTLYEAACAEAGLPAYESVRQSI